MATLVIGPGISIGEGITLDSYPGPQQEYTIPGTYTWVVPVGVTSVCVICVGGGGGGWKPNYAGGGGGGGGLVWVNDIAVTAGQSYSINVGAGSAASTGTAGGNSWFNTSTYIVGAGGQGGQGGQTGFTQATGGTYTNNSGYTGGGGNGAEYEGHKGAE